MKDDVINRQVALQAIDTWDKFGCGPDGRLVRYDDDSHYVPYVHYDDMVHAIEHLPSAEPEQPSEIQDILNYLNTVLHPIISPEYWDVYSELHDMISSLPSAQPRMRGKWIKVHGFSTPGGDPVWRCSECGKGLHTYGIEASTYGADIAEHQWVSCPNCGADMREEVQDESDD